MSLTRHLGKGISGLLAYESPGLHRDSANHDHVLSLAFRGIPARVSEACTEILTAHVVAFNAYVGYVGLEELLHFDFPHTQGKVDARHQVYRVHQAMFLDETLSRRAFGLTATALRARLAPFARLVSPLGSGILFVLSTDVLSLEQSNGLNQAASQALRCVE